MSWKLISVSMPQELLEEVNKFVENSEIPTDRSKIIQKSLRTFMDKQR